MRSLVKHGLIVASIAALAVACGSNNSQQQAKEPVGTADNNNANAAQPSSAWNDTSSMTTTSPSMNATGPQQSALDNTTPEDKSFAGPTANPNDQTGSATTNEGSMQAKQNTSLADGEIFAIETALNNGEVTLAQIAKKNGKSEQVRDFAAMMISQHQDAQNKAKALATKAKITAQDDDVSNKIKSEGTSVQADLKGKKGTDFDKAYMDSQVKMHTEGLDIIDNQLLPSVKNADMKDHLNTVRQHVQMHLSKAQDIQSRMEAVGTTSVTSGTMKGKGDTSTTTSGQTPGSSSTKSDTGKKKGSSDTTGAGGGSTGSGGTSGTTHHDTNSNGGSSDKGSGDMK
jgi:putative membrane protein